MELIAIHAADTTLRIGLNTSDECLAHYLIARGSLAVAGRARRCRPQLIHHEKSPSTRSLRSEALRRFRRPEGGQFS